MSGSESSFVVAAVQAAPRFLDCEATVELACERMVHGSSSTSLATGADRTFSS
jgi:hypothetical protein